MDRGNSLPSILEQKVRPGCDTQLRDDLSCSLPAPCSDSLALAEQLCMIPRSEESFGILPQLLLVRLSQSEESCLRGEGGTMACFRQEEHYFKLGIMQSCFGGVQE